MKAISDLRFQIADLTAEGGEAMGFWVAFLLGTFWGICLTLLIARWLRQQEARHLERMRREEGERKCKMQIAKCKLEGEKDQPEPQKARLIPLIILRDEEVTRN